jgi:hypothetical protein
MRSITRAIFVTAALLMVGCAGCYTATVAGGGYGPDLVYAAPGVQVIADYDEPIFYADNFYWRFYGGAWYRSPRYTGGWVYARPPIGVARIDRPYAYVHYRPNGWVGHRQPVAPQPVARGWRGGRPGFEARRAEPVRRPPTVQPPPPRAAPPRGVAPQPGRGGDRRGDGNHPGGAWRDGR